MWLVLITKAQTYTLTHYDCNTPTSIQSYTQTSMCQPPTLSPETDTKLHYTVLQRPTVQKVTGYSCQILVSRFHFKCGAWSHLKLGSVPTLNRPQEVTIQDCEHLVRKLEYSIAGQAKSIKLELNQPAFVEFTATGSLDLKDDRIVCEGQPLRINGVLHQNEVLLEERRILVKEERFLVDQALIESQDEHVRLPCKFQHLGCITGMRTYVWYKNLQICDLQAVKTIQPSWTMGSYLVDHQQKFIVNITGKTRLPGCLMEVHQTEHDNILVIPTNKHFVLPKVDPTEVDVVLQDAMHLNYLAYSLERAISHNKHQSKHLECLRQQGYREDEPTPLEGGKFGLIKGDLFLVFECLSKTSEIREESTCYQDIPIKPSGYVKPLTRQQVAHSNPVPCSSTFPLSIRAEEGWIQITPHLKLRPNPLEMKPDQDELEMEDFSAGGLYSQKELDDWKHTLNFPAYEQAVLKSITYGTCVESGTCDTGPSDEITPYSLNTLIPSIEGKLDLYHRFKEFLHMYGDFMAFLCLLIMTVKFLSDIVMVTITALQAGPGAAAAFLVQIYCYNQQTYRRIMRRHEQKKESTGAEDTIPLQSVNKPTTTAPTTPLRWS